MFLKNNLKIKSKFVDNSVKELVDAQAKFLDGNKQIDIKSALKVGLILLLDEHLTS